MQDLWNLGHALEVTSRRMLKRLGVTGPQRLVLLIVGRRPGLSAGEIAMQLALHPSTLTGMLRRLEEQRFLQRTIDPADARRARFSLTARGARVNAVRGGTVEEAVGRAIAESLPIVRSNAVLMTRRLIAQLSK
jgi:DNA-binding MarR family transcriptional regulator